MERVGDLLLEDVAVALPKLPALVTGIERIAARNGVLISTVAHAGDGNAHPMIAHDAANRLRGPRRRGVQRDHRAHDRPRRDDHRRARRRPAEGSLASRPARAGCHGPDPAHQGRPRPGRHPQPRSGDRGALSRGTRQPRLGPAAGSAPARLRVRAHRTFGRCRSCGAEVGGRFTVHR